MNGLELIVFYRVLLIHFLWLYDPQLEQKRGKKKCYRNIPTLKIMATTNTEVLLNGKTGESHLTFGIRYKQRIYKAPISFLYLSSSRMSCLVKEILLGENTYHLKRYIVVGVFHPFDFLYDTSINAKDMYIISVIEIFPQQK